MTSRTKQEPGWDANGSPVDTADFRDEYGELCEWAANEARLKLVRRDAPEDTL